MIAILFILLFSCNIATEPYSTKHYQADQHTEYQIIRKIERPNHKFFFTEGLSFVSPNILLESSGLYGQSEIHYLSYPQLIISQRTHLQQQLFGEGSVQIVLSNISKNYMLTYRERKILEFDQNMKLLRQIIMPKAIREGWGMTKYIHDNKQVLLISDGSNLIHHVDPNNWNVLKSVSVNNPKNNKPIKNLNELEIYKGSLLANIWMTNNVARIDPETGLLLSIYDMSQLEKDVDSSKGYEHYTNSNYVLNGIAYDEQNDCLIMTGKMWPFFYQVQFFDKK